MSDHRHAGAPLPPVHLDLTGRPTDPARARTFLRAAAEDWQLGADVTDTAVLLVSELVTNAIRYAAGDCDVTLTRSPGSLCVSVHDGVDDLQLPDVPVSVDPGDEHGRGLHLVDILAGRWGVQQVPDDGKRVWFELPA